MKAPSTTASDFDSCRGGNPRQERTPFSSAISRLVRRSKAASALAGTFAAVALACSSPAAAETGHVFSSSFNVSGNPSAIAIDEEGGYVYVQVDNPEPVRGNIYKYTLSGAPSNFAALGSNVLPSTCEAGCRTLAVDNTGGVNQGVIYQGTNPSPEAENETLSIITPNGRRSTPIGFRNNSLKPVFCGVAINPGGVLYAVRSDNGTLVTYKPGQVLPDPSPPQEWPVRAVMTNVGEIGGSYCDVAVDSKRSIYVIPESSGTATSLEGSPQPVLRYLADPFTGGELTSAIVDSKSVGIAVDQSTDDLYSSHISSIARFNAGGERREVFGLGVVNRTEGIAVDASTGAFYEGNRTESKVNIFTKVTTPDADSLAAIPNQTGASLSATVDTAAAGNITSCQFEYGLTEAYGSTAPCSGTLPFTEEKSVSASLFGLTKETTYYYRLAVGNPNGTTHTPDRTFSTHNVAGLTTDKPTNVTQSSATLNGSFDGNGEATTVFFEWGTDTSYGSTTPSEPAGIPTDHTTVSAPITGLSTYLADSAPYHVRLVATNGAGTSYGPDRAFFAAPPNLPAVHDVGASEVTNSSFKAEAVVNPGNGPTSYWIEYGLNTGESATVPSPPIGEDEVDHPVETVIAGLIAGRTYRFRIDATNFAGTTIGPERTVNIPDTPKIGSVGVSAITETSGTLKGSVSPGFLATTYSFQFGLTRGYEFSSSEQTIAGGNNDSTSVSSPIAGLKPGVNYHYRLVVSNALGSIQTTDGTFTTTATATVKQGKADHAAHCKKGFVQRHGKCFRKKKHRKRGSHRGSNR